jgi:hypothetical protein
MKTARLKLIGPDGCPACLEMQVDDDMDESDIRDSAGGMLSWSTEVLSVEIVSQYDRGGTEI